MIDAEMCIDVTWRADNCPVHEIADQCESLREAESALDMGFGNWDCDPELNA